MNSLSLEFVILQTQNSDSHQGTNWSKKQNYQPKNPAQISLPRHKTVHKQECNSVLSANRDSSFNVKKAFICGQESMSQPKT